MRTQRLSFLLLCLLACGQSPPTLLDGGSSDTGPSDHDAGDAEDAALEDAGFADADRADVGAAFWDPAASELGRFLEDVGEREWARFPMGDLEGQDLPLLEFCEEAPWIDLTGKLSIINSGHGAPGEMVVYDAPTNTWTRHPTAREPQERENRMGHCYDHQSVRQDQGHLYFGTYVANDAVGGPLFVWDTTTDTWFEQPVEHQFEGDHNSFLWFPERRSFVMQNRRVLRELVPDNDWSWRWLGRLPESIGRSHGVAEYDVRGGRIVFGGGDYPTSRQLFELDADGEVHELDPAPFDIGSSRSKVVADPVSGDVLAWRTVRDTTASMAVLPSGSRSWRDVPIDEPWVAEALHAAGGHGLVVTRMPVFGVVGIIGFPGDWWRTPPMFLVYRHATLEEVAE